MNEQEVIQENPFPNVIRAMDEGLYEGIGPDEILGEDPLSEKIGSEPIKQNSLTSLLQR